MSYTALYRKFRPDEFEDVKGQDAIVRTVRRRLQKYLRKQSTANIR